MKIDFYLYNAHEIALWETIIHALIKRGVDARFVLEPPGQHTAMGSQPDPADGYRDVKTKDLVPLLTEDDFDFNRTLLTARRHSYLLRGRYREADAVVTTQGVGWLWRYECLKLKTAYGCPANEDVYGHSEMNRGLDGVFVHGEHDRERIARHVPEEDVIVAGYPKFAPFLRGEVSRDRAAARFGISPTRKTVVYFPTWAHNSSIDHFAESVAMIGRTYNVIVKPHHNNLHFERERYAQLRRSAYVLVDEQERDIVPFLAVADLVLADVRSGSLTEAFLTNRTTIALSPTADPSVTQVIDGLSDAAPVCWDPSVLGRLVDELLLDDPFIKARRELAKRLFSCFDGRDDEVMANCMLRHIARRTAERLVAV